MLHVVWLLARWEDTQANKAHGFYGRLHNDHISPFACIHIFNFIFRIIFVFICAKVDNNSFNFSIAQLLYGYVNLMQYTITSQ